MKPVFHNMCGPPIPKLKPQKKTWKNIMTNSNSTCKLLTYIQSEHINKYCKNVLKIRLNNSIGKKV